MVFTVLALKSVVTNANPIVLSDIDQDSSDQIAPDKTDPYLDLSVQQQAPQDVNVAEDQVNQNFFDPIEQLSSAAQNSPSVSIPADAIALGTKNDIQECGDATDKATDKGTIIRICPITPKKLPTKPDCESGNLFCCPQRNARGKPNHCFPCMFSPLMLQFLFF